MAPKDHSGGPPGLLKGVEGVVNPILGNLDHSDGGDGHGDNGNGNGNSDHGHFSPSPPPPPSPNPAPPPPSSPAPSQPQSQPQPQPQSPPSSPQPAPPASGSSNGGGSSGATSPNGGGNPAPNSNPSGANGSPQGSPSTPSTSPGTPPSVPANAPVSVISGTTFFVTPTGLVPNPANNVIASQGPSASGIPNGSNQQGPSLNGASDAGLNPTLTDYAGAVPTNRGSNGANDGSDSGTSAAKTTSAKSQSHMSGGAIAGILIALMFLAFFVLFVLRRRHQLRKRARELEWIKGFPEEDPSAGPSMLQRSDTKRSSWGTPVEYQQSDLFRQSFASSSSGSGSGLQSDNHSYNYVVTSPFTDGGGQFQIDAPTLPSPVHSPTQGRQVFTEDPFSDRSAPAQPVREMAALPLRVSVISSASGHENPFDDNNTGMEISDEPAAMMVMSPSSIASFGPGVSKNMSFPLPPTSPKPFSSPKPPQSPSHNTSPEKTRPPTISISRADTPPNPTAEASGTPEYPRRATAQTEFVPTDMTDRGEVRVNRGDVVSIISLYEDGWAFIERENDKKRGLVPLSLLSM